jgi:predicted lipoprotein with Yx(FWY)xxD motif
MKPKAQLILGVTLSGSLAVLGFAIPGASAHPAKPAKATAVKVHLRKISTLGKVLVNGKSHTIYMFGKDTSKKSHCGSTCKIYWPPVISKKKPIAEAGLSKKHLSRIAKTDQVTYYGHPLYTYLVDTKAGKDKGEGISDFGARWYVVSAKGKAVKPKKATTPVGGGGSTPTPTPTATHSAAPPYIPAAPTAIAGVTTGTVGSATLLQNAADTHTLYYLTGDVHVNGTFSCTNACQQI